VPVLVAKLLELWITLLLDAFFDGLLRVLLCLLFKVLLVLIELSELAHDRFTTVERQAVGAGVADLDHRVMTDGSTRRLHLLH